MKNTNIITINCKSDNGNYLFYRYWLEFLSPFHHMTNTEYDVSAWLLNYRFELSKLIKEDAILDNVLFSKESRAKITDELGIKPLHLRVIFNKLKNKGIIVNGALSKKLIPNIEEGAEKFSLILNFELV